MNSIYDKFKLLLLSNNLLKDNDKILLGVSGGSDSIALLDLFLTLKAEIKIFIDVAHVNYNLRGTDSDLDEELIRSICKKAQVDCFVLNVGKELLEKSYGRGLEEKARNIRYKYFNELKRTYHYSKISVAHTKDDLVETLLFNLIRGTSPEKFAYILPLYDCESCILRPLIEFTKKELIEYNINKRLEFRVDETNKDTKYSRNRIRNEIVPHIRKINPSFENSIFKFREILKIEESFIDREIDKQFDGDNIVRTDNSVLILKNYFISLHDALKLRILRKIRETLTGTLKDFYYSEIVYIKNGLMKTDNFKYFDKFIKIYIKSSWIIIENIKEGNNNE